MIFTHPRCFQCLPTQENLTTKTLNPKVPCFVVPSFSFFKFSLKICKEHLYSSLQLTKSCHVLPNRDTVDAYDPRYDKTYPKNVPNKPKIVSCFPKIVSRFDTLKTMLTTQKILTHLRNRVTIPSFPNLSILSHIPQSLYETYNQ